jgi:hypothetical protein
VAEARAEALNASAVATQAAQAAQQAQQAQMSMQM